MKIDKKTGEVLDEQGKPVPVTTPNGDVNWDAFTGAPINNMTGEPLTKTDLLDFDDSAPAADIPADETPKVAPDPVEAEALAIAKAVSVPTPEFDSLGSLALTEEEVAHLTPSKVQWAYLKAQEQLVALVLEHRRTGLTAIEQRHVYERDAAMKRGEIQFTATKEGKKMTVDDLKASVDIVMASREAIAETWELMAGAGREAIEAKKYECDMLRSLNSALLAELTKAQA
jgi:hypothetical protein